MKLCRGQPRLRNAERRSTTQNSADALFLRAGRYEVRMATTTRRGEKGTTRQIPHACASAVSTSGISHERHIRAREASTHTGVRGGGRAPRYEILSGAGRNTPIKLDTIFDYRLSAVAKSPSTEPPSPQSSCAQTTVGRAQTFSLQVSSRRWR